MSLLTVSDRDFILEQLKLAPDSVLTDAMLEFNAIRDKVLAVRNMALNHVQPTEVVEAQYKPRPNVDPGKPSIGKIGTETKESLLLDLRSGKQPAAKWAEHLKLLWVRGEIRFDGSEYYV